MLIVTPYLHILSMMVLMGAIITQHLVLKPGIQREQVSALAKVDMIYIISFLLVLVTGLLRWFVWGKGSEFYLSNPFFHTKLTLFVIVGILSFWPTKWFLKWNKEFRKGNNPEISDKRVKSLLLFLRIELLLIAIIPLLAVMVARGYGM